MESGKIKKDDVLWFEEFVTSDLAYKSAFLCYQKLDALLNNRPESEEFCDIQFPHIVSDLDKCEVLENQKLMELIKKAYDTYFDGVNEGIAEGIYYIMEKG